MDTALVYIIMVYVTTMVYVIMSALCYPLVIKSF